MQTNILIGVADNGSGYLMTLERLLRTAGCEPPG